MRRGTRIVVILSAAVWVLWDIAAYLYGGVGATISVVTGDWLAKSYWLVLGVGLLVGHLLASTTVAGGVGRWIVLAVGLVLGWYCTKWE